MTHEIADRVPSNSPGAAEIGFAIPERYNASRILFDSLAATASSARKHPSGATASSRWASSAAIAS